MLLMNVQYEGMNMNVHMLSCWKYVEEPVENILKHKQKTLEVVKIITSTGQLGLTKHIIASYLTNYLCEEIITACLFFTSLL